MASLYSLTMSGTQTMQLVWRRAITIDIHTSRYGYIEILFAQQREPTGAPTLDTIDNTVRQQSTITMPSVTVKQKNLSMGLLAELRNFGDFEQ